MDCPQCGEAVEPGAAFCGNCGRALRAVQDIPPAGPVTDAGTSDTPDAPGTPDASAADPVPVPDGPIPGYAKADPRQSRGEVKAMLALIIAILAVPGALIPALGAALAMAGIVLATMSRQTPKVLSNTAIGFAGLAVILSLGMYIYQLNHPPEAPGGQGAASSDRTAGGTSDTPCYKVDLPKLGVLGGADGGCNLQAGNAGTLADSSEIFTVDTAKRAEATQAGFMAMAKEIVGSTFKDMLPGYTIVSQKQGSFAGSPAYITDAKDSGGSTVQMAMVFHPVKHGENIFVVVHSQDKGQASVAGAEKNWRWK